MDAPHSYCDGLRQTRNALTSTGAVMKTMTTVPFFHHDLGSAELESIAKVLKGPILTTGDTVKEFETSFAKLMGSQHALGVTSCTGALHMSLVALGIGAGDEVITTPMTFIATATSIIEAGAKPVLVDCEPDTGNLDAERIESAISSKTKAIMPVHLYGQMCDMRRIHAIAQKHNLHVIEDAAHCVEGSRDGVRPGELADTCCFSFYATKNLTCGEGGAVTCNSDELQNKLRLLRTHGMDKTAADRAKEGYQHWDMVMLGWKYNMDNIQAAILLPQMDRLEDNFKKRQNLAEYFERKIATINGLRTPAMRPDVVHARHLFPILIDGGRRDHFINGLKARNIGVMVNYRAIHLLSYFRNSYGYKSGDFPNAEKFGDSILSLPFYPNMPEEHVEIIAEALKEIAATH